MIPTGGVSQLSGCCPPYGYHFNIPGVYSEFSIDIPLKIKGRSKQGHEIDFFFYRVHFKRRDSLFLRNVIITL